MTQDEIFEAIQKTLESSQKTLEAQRLANAKPKRNAVEAWLEQHKSIMGLFGIAATLLTIFLTIRSLSNEGQKRVNEALNQAFTQQIDQTTNDINVVKLMTDHMQALPGKAISTDTKSNGEMLPSEKAAVLWTNDATQLLGKYAAFSSFQLNESAIESLNSVFNTLLAKEKEPPADAEASTVARITRKNDAKENIRTQIIAPQIKAGASSFDPTVRCASLQLSSYLTAVNPSLVDIDTNAQPLENLRKAFGGQFLGKVTYSSGELMLGSYVLSKARFDNATFKRGVSFACENGETRLDGCHFDKADFEGVVSFDGAYLGDAFFNEAKFALSKGKVSFSKSTLDNTDFSGAKFADTAFLDVKLVAPEKRPKFEGAEFLRNVQFSMSALNGVSFFNAVFQNLAFKGKPKPEERTQMRSVSFQNVKRSPPPPPTSPGSPPPPIAPPEKSDLLFEGIDLSDSFFATQAVPPAPATTCDLTKAIFTSCTLDKINFANTNLTEVAMKSCNGSKVIFASNAAASSSGPQVGMPTLIDSGSFTDGSWLANIEPVVFKNGVEVNNSFISQSVVSARQDERYQGIKLVPSTSTPNTDCYAFYVDRSGGAYVLIGTLHLANGSTYRALTAKDNWLLVYAALNICAAEIGLEAPKDPIDNTEAQKAHWRAQLSKHSPPIILN